MYLVRKGNWNDNWSVMLRVLLADFKLSFVSSTMLLSLLVLHFLFLFPFIAFEAQIPLQESTMLSEFFPSYFEIFLILTEIGDKDLA
jgi:hypothetical protein